MDWINLKHAAILVSVTFSDIWLTTFAHGQSAWFLQRRDCRLVARIAGDLEGTLSLVDLKTTLGENCMQVRSTYVSEQIQHVHIMYPDGVENLWIDKTQKYVFLRVYDDSPESIFERFKSIHTSDGLHIFRKDTTTATQGQATQGQALSI